MIDPTVNLDHFREVMNFVSTSPHRNLAIVGCSYCEHFVMELIELQPFMNKSHFKRLFGESRPLYNFIPRIDFLNMINVLSDNICEDVKTIGKIRNKFAHNLSLETFADQDIEGLISNFRDARAPEMGPGNSFDSAWQNGSSEERFTRGLSSVVAALANHVTAARLRSIESI